MSNFKTGDVVKLVTSDLFGVVGRVVDADRSNPDVEYTVAIAVDENQAFGSSEEKSGIALKKVWDHQIEII